MQGSKNVKGMGKKFGSVSAVLISAAMIAPVRGETGVCNPVTSVIACQGEKVGTDAAAPFCGAGLVCEFSGPSQECGCAVAVAECPPADVNECCNPATSGAGSFTDDEGQSITVTGGQVSGAGATLFVDFFLSPSSTVDVVDVDGDSIAGFCDPGANPTGCPPGSFQFVDQLAAGYQDGSPLNTHWMFQYRSVGSVNGFNEFVGNQLCGTFVRTIPSEAGQFNQVTYASGGSILNDSPGDYGTGSPVQPCEINFSFLDVPSAWGVQVPGANGVCLIKCQLDTDCPSGETCICPVGIPCLGSFGWCSGLPACSNDDDCLEGKCWGGAKWDAQPSYPGYGLNPIPSSTGYISNLQSLSRNCGSCSLGGNICDLDSNCNGTQKCIYGACTISNLPCAGDGDCPLVTGQTCVAGGGGPVSLNSNIGNPDNDTLFDFIGAVVPVAYIANRGTNVENVKYSEMQYLFVTGRMPNGENLVGATRSVGSGTRNAIMNSTGIDTSWGRGDNVGPEYILTAQSNLGPGHQASNGQGSTQVENAVEQRRLAIGTTGLGGPSRAIVDAQGFRYEILNLCKDVDTNGNPLCNCNIANACAARRQCSGTPSIKCLVDGDCPIGESCSGKIQDAAAPNNGYVRPSTDTVLDNCDPCCGYTIVGNGSFVTRGDPQQSDPGAPDYLNDGAVRDYINNISTSVGNFSGLNPNVCVFAKVCSIKECTNIAGMACATDADCGGGANTCANVNCNVDADCVTLGAGGTCDVPRPCTTNSQCRNCDNNPTIACTMDAQCGGGTCPSDFCLNALNTPGQFLATTFTLPDGVDCTQSFDDGMVFDPNANLNQVLQNFQRNPPPPLTSAFPTPAFGSVNANSGGRVPLRKTGFTYSDGKSGANVQYIYYSGGGGYTQNLGAGQQLAKRNRVQGDFNEDCERNLDDAGELVEALFTPRAWQQTAEAINTGGGCYGSAFIGNQTTGGIDGAVPEVIGDFDGDGSLTKEDLRYFMDGLALRRKRCCTMSLDKCVTDNDCPEGQTCDPCDLCSESKVKCHQDGDCPGGVTDLCELAAFKLNRKDGAIAIDNAIVGLGRPYPWAESEPSLCSVADQPCYDDSQCPGGETCTRPMPNGDLRRYLIMAPVPPNEPTFFSLRLVNDAIRPFLSTGAVYEPGDFRGDVAGGRSQRCLSNRCTITGFACNVDGDCPMVNANAGGDPIGWDGQVDAADVEYCCEQAKIGAWAEINDAVYIDLSCDMDGDLDVDGDDVRELVEVILEAPVGDADLDGDVDQDDRALFLFLLKGTGQDCAGSAGADANFDGVVDFCDWALSGGYGDVFPTNGGDGFVDVGDILCILDGFAGEPTCENVADIFPCPAGDGFVDVGDILAVLDAFAGFPLDCCVP
jgi:hypothetical protein